jgi:hypothetical protein
MAIERATLKTLTQKMREGLKTMRDEKAFITAKRNTVFLLDVSGSMVEVVDGKRKIDHLREVMREYADMKKVSFSETVFEDTIPEPRANTDMALGFTYLLAQPPRRVVLVSDGVPDSEETAEEAALKLKCPVDIIFIGQKGSRGEAFMKRLAQMTGGAEFTAETTIGFREQLAEGIRGMLPEAKL